MVRFFVRVYFIGFVCLAGSYCAFSSGTAGEKAAGEPRYIVDMPTAGLLSKGAYSIYSVAFTGGGVLLEISASPFSDFNMGISFSGSNIIGRGEIVWQEIPAVQLRYRVIDETRSIPAFAVGINTQGRGGYEKKYERYQTMSPGLYAVASKAFCWALGSMAFHAGVCYSFEPSSGDRSPNIYFGIEQALGNSFSVNFEYNANLDDNNKDLLSKKSLLNASMRLSVAKGFTAELQLRDLLSNQVDIAGFSRFFCIEFTSSF